MAYTTFPRSSSIGAPQEAKITEVCNTIRTPFQAGYVQTRAKNQHMVKRLEFRYVALDYNMWRYIMRFWYSRRGGAEAFYFQYPATLTTAGQTAGSTNDENYGWDTEVTYSSSEGPYKLVRFAGDELLQSYNKDIKRWDVVINLETV